MLSKEFDTKYLRLISTPTHHCIFELVLVIKIGFNMSKSTII